MKIVFRADASLEIGTGHVMRCLTLAKALIEQGAEVHFICRQQSGNLIEKIRQERINVYSLPKVTSKKVKTGVKADLFHAQWLGASQQEDAEQCQQILKDIKADWLIVDHYALDQEWEVQLKQYYKHLFVIDDLGDRKHVCDVLLDQNYGSTNKKYRGLVPLDCQLLVGPTYALLRSEFSNWREYSLQRRENPELKSLLITMGGVDAENYTGKILAEIRNSNALPRNIEINVVMGETAPYLKKVTEIAETMPYKTAVLTGVNNMAEVMANSDLAIGAAGATTWERCCLGLPTIQMVIAENQRQIANALVKDSVIELAYKIEDILGCIEKATSVLEQLSLASRKVVNGQGVKQIIKYLTY